MSIVTRLKRALRALADRLVPWTVDIPEHLTKPATPAVEPVAARPVLKVIDGGKAGRAAATYPRPSPRSCNTSSASSRRIG